MPTSQSASARATAEEYRFSYSFPLFRFANPCLIALSVTEEIHKRLIGLRVFDFSMIHLATSSPSRPASVAIIISCTSFRCICAFTALYCLPVCLMTTRLNGLGIIGKCSNFHDLYCSPYFSGSANVTRCPNAHVTIYLSPSMNPVPFLVQVRTRAMSLPAEGLSARTTDFIVIPPTHSSYYTRFQIEGIKKTRSYLPSLVNHNRKRNLEFS